MNHYERLKVTQDAPVEVVHAAYLALVGALTAGQGDGAGDAAALTADLTADQRECLMALNTAHDVLMDVDLRARYDAQLAEPVADVDLPWVDPAPVPVPDWGPTDATQFSLPASAPSGAPVAQRWIALALGAVLLVGLGVWTWQSFDTFSQGRRLSEDYASHPASAVADGAHDQPTVDELAKMSDEELVKVLPTLDASNPAAQTGTPHAPATPSKRHPLDGVPLKLRSEHRLVDPLASDAQP